MEIVKVTVKMADGTEKQAERWQCSSALAFAVKHIGSLAAAPAPSDKKLVGTLGTATFNYDVAYMLASGSVKRARFALPAVVKVSAPRKRAARTRKSA